ncbi:hypothetical protein D3C75_514700 [compost metagenome]
MKEDNWLETAFVTYFKYYLEDGRTQRVFTLFGVPLLLGDETPYVWHSGFMLSLYNVIYLKDVEPKTDAEALKRHRTIPLLSWLVGNHVEKEEPFEESAYNTTVRGIRYTITRWGRWTSYERFQWFALKGTRINVYHIASDDDKQLPDYTFAPPDWADRTPSPEEVVNAAHEMYKPMNDLKAGMSGAEHNPQSNDKQ